MGFPEKLCGETSGRCMIIGLGRFDALRLFLAPPYTHHNEEKSVAPSAGQHTRMSCQASRENLQQAGPACHQDTRVCSRVSIWTATS